MAAKVIINNALPQDAQLSIWLCVIGGLTKRRLHIIILFAQSLSASCYGQETDFLGMEVPLFEGRLAGGMNISAVDGDGYGGYHKVGIQAGAMVYVNLSPGWAVSAEILYTTKGARGAHIRESQYVGTYFDKYYLNLDYVELPLMIHRKRYRLLDYEAGISYARLVSSREWGSADVPVIIFPEYNYFNTQDVCINGGMAVRIGKKMWANARMQYSLLAIRPPERIPERYYTYHVGEYNKVITLRIMYTL